MPRYIYSYPELTRAIAKDVGLRKAQRMSKGERLDYARSQGWVYNPPANYGANVKPTATIQKEQVVREDGKIVATLKTPEKTYEQRAAEDRAKIKYEKQKAYNKYVAEQQLKKNIENKTGVAYTDNLYQARYVRKKEPIQEPRQMQPTAGVYQTTSVNVPAYGYKKVEKKPTGQVVDYYASTKFEYAVETAAARRKASEERLGRIHETAGKLTLSMGKPYEERSWFGKFAQTTTFYVMGSPFLAGEGLARGTEGAYLTGRALVVDRRNTMSALKQPFTGQAEEYKQFRAGFKFWTPEGAAMYTTIGVSAGVYSLGKVKGKGTIEPPKTEKAIYEQAKVEKVHIPEKVEGVTISKSGRVKSTIATQEFKRIPKGYDVPNVKAATKTQFFDPHFMTLNERQTVLRSGGSERSYWEALGIRETTPTTTAIRQEAAMKGQTKFKVNVLDDNAKRLLKAYDTHSPLTGRQTALPEYITTRRVIGRLTMMKDKSANLRGSLSFDRVYESYRGRYVSEPFKVTPFESNIRTGSSGMFRQDPFFMSMRSQQTGVMSIQQSGTQYLQRVNLQHRFENVELFSSKIKDRYSIQQFQSQFRVVSLGQQQRQRLSFAQSIPSLQPFSPVSVTPKFKTPSEPNIKPFGFKIPSFDFDDPEPKKGKDMFKYANARQPKEYIPSLFAVALGIRGKATKSGIKTGLGIRPIKV